VGLMSFGGFLSPANGQVLGAHITNGTFQANQCTVLTDMLGQQGCYGGGLFAWSMNVDGNTSFVNNTAKGWGGGAYAFDASSLTGATFQDNVSTFDGGDYMWPIRWI